MSQLKIKFSGSVLDLKIELEGQEVGLYFDGVSEWSRTLENYDIKGTLDLVMLCKGLDGTTWQLELIINDNNPKTYSGEINKGYSLISDEIEIPLKS